MEKPGEKIGEEGKEGGRLRNDFLRDDEMYSFDLLIIRAKNTTLIKISILDSK